jgi:hypothetical protein
LRAGELRRYLRIAPPSLTTRASCPIACSCQKPPARADFRQSSARARPGRTFIGTHRMRCVVNPWRLPSCIGLRYFLSTFTTFRQGGFHWLHPRLPRGAVRLCYGAPVFPARWDGIGHIRLQPVPCSCVHLVKPAFLQPHS